MGLSHGGMRQKIFNAYEETIRVPLVVSSPALFSEPRVSDALVSLVDIVPTMLSLAGRADTPEHLDGCDLGPLLDGSADSVRDAVLFTYDDHQAGAALQEGPGQPNRVRCVRDARWKYAVYLDPYGREEPEFEMYDLDGDPDERLNLLDRRTGRPISEAYEHERARLSLRLAQLCADVGELTPALPL
jgi:arylsulfatase A-like enzyme